MPLGDRGFWHGFGLFETVRVVGGRLPFLERHVERLRRSALLLGLSADGAGERWAYLAREAVRRGGVEDGTLRLALTAGEGGAFSRPAGRPTVVALAVPGGGYAEEAAERGWRAVVARVRRDSTSLLAAVKSLSYLPSVLARLEAGAAGADEALVLNERGELAEGAAANLFFVRGGCLCTPDLACGVLPGVTRSVVLEEARGWLPVEEGRYGLADLMTAEEAFFTSALAGVMPLLAVGGQPVGEGRPGPVTREMRRRYLRRAGITGRGGAGTGIPAQGGGGTGVPAQGGAGAGVSGRGGAGAGG